MHFKASTGPLCFFPPGVWNVVRSSSSVWYALKKVWACPIMAAALLWGIVGWVCVCMGRGLRVLRAQKQGPGSLWSMRAQGCCRLTEVLSTGSYEKQVSHQPRSCFHWSNTETQSICLHAEHWWNFHHVKCCDQRSWCYVGFRSCIWFTY